MKLSKLSKRNIKISLIGIALIVVLIVLNTHHVPEMKGYSVDIHLMTSEVYSEDITPEQARYFLQTYYGEYMRWNTPFTKKLQRIDIISVVKKEGTNIFEVSYDLVPMFFGNGITDVGDKVDGVIQGNHLIVLEANYIEDEVWKNGVMEITCVENATHASYDLHASKNKAPSSSPQVITMGQYKIHNAALMVTTNNHDWIRVPVELERLSLEDTGKLVENTYYISEGLIMILTKESPTQMITSYDKGETWQDEVIEHEPLSEGVVNKYLYFTNSKEGVFVYSSNKVMSQAYGAILKTSDGGKSWYYVGDVPEYFIPQGVTFVNIDTGFILYPGNEMKEDRLYYTNDRGSTWSLVELPVGETQLSNGSIQDVWFNVYQGKTLPYYNNDNDLILTINRGYSDYPYNKKAAARYISKNNGVTWEFVEKFEEIDIN